MSKKREQEHEDQAGQEDAQEPQEPQEGQEAQQDHQEPQEPVEDAQGPQEGEQEPAEDDAEAEGDTFPRAYVEKLRREAAEAHTRAKRADDLAGALWAARVAATGRLADPTDLPMPEGADPMDPAAVDTAVAELLAAKPHLASRVPRGFVAQGSQPEPPAAPSLSAMLRAGAMN